MQNDNKYIPEILELNFCNWNITDEIAGIFEKGRQREGDFDIEVSTLEKEYPTLKKSLYFAKSEFDGEIEEFHDLMRIYGATKAQITWDLYNNIKLRPRDQKNCETLLDHITTINKVIIINLGTIKFFSKYMTIPQEDLEDYASIEGKYRFTEKYHEIKKQLKLNQWED